MTIQHRFELDTIALFTLSAIVGVVLAMYSSPQPKFRSFSVSAVQYLQNILPTPTPFPRQTIETSQISPDGTKKIMMTMTINDDSSKTYSFTVSGTDTQEKLIYSATLSPSENMSIPFNTWSPDNTYVFLQNNTASYSGALVMRANGQPITTDHQSMNVKELFTKRNTGDTYQETTGWASDALLIINTTAQDGSKGPSYWFEVPSEAIIQLSTQF